MGDSGHVVGNVTNGTPDASVASEASMARAWSFV